ncbi:MAG TPA: hypothetical protein PKX92_13570, partial [Edaphocola sp.]|nr:hypothetical protein [Edaphocola sp.]
IFFEKTFLNFNQHPSFLYLPLFTALRTVPVSFGSAKVKAYFLLTKFILKNFFRCLLPHRSPLHLLS